MMCTMSVVSRVSRPMLAAIFIHGGIDSFRNAKQKAYLAEPVVRALAERIPLIPDDTATVVRYDAAAKVVGGAAMALGVFPRLAALGLATSLVPTTLAGHRFWEEDEPGKRTMQRIHFLKNVGLLGGLLLSAADTGGRPSLAWRARRLPRSVRHTAHDVRRDAPAAVLSTVSAARDRLPV
jgi:putative oxidoreductase